MWLTRRCVKRYLHSTTKTHPIRRNYHRQRAKLDRLRHVLKRADSHLDLVPLLFLDAKQKLHQIRADRKVCGIARNDKGFEVVDDLARWLKCLRNQTDDIVAKRVHL